MPTPITNHKKAINKSVTFIRDNPGSTKNDVRNHLVAEFNDPDITNAMAADELDLLKLSTYELGYTDDGAVPWSNFRNFVEALVGSQVKPFKDALIPYVESTVQAEINRLEAQKVAAQDSRTEARDDRNAIKLITDASVNDQVTVTADMQDGAEVARQVLNGNIAGYDRIIELIDARLALLQP